MLPDQPGGIELADTEKPAHGSGADAPWATVVEVLSVHPLLSVIVTVCVVFGPRPVIV